MAKKCLVLGGGSDIGAAVIRELHASYDVTWTYFSSPRTAESLPGRRMKCDLRSTRSISHLFDDRGGLANLDLVVTAAFPFLESDNFDFQAYLRAEEFLRGHVYAFTRVAETMNRDGRIINMLGQCVERGLPGAAFYSAAFAFLHNYSNSINGQEGKAGKLSVCDLLLGPVDTREWDGLSPEVVARYKSRVSQFISTQQVAQTVRFLAESAVMPSTFKLDAYYGQ